MGEVKYKQLYSVFVFQMWREKKIIRHLCLHCVYVLEIVPNSLEGVLTDYLLGLTAIYTKKKVSWAIKCRKRKNN